jgi:hypothetical protein
MHKIALLPSQFRRLIIFVVAIVAVFLAVRSYFIPETFGKYGHYRAAAIDSVLLQEMNYAGHQACIECHDDIEEQKRNSYHKGVNCEACHGPGQAHIESVGEIELAAPRDRGYCVLCHVYNPAKPTGFPQIDPFAHNPVKPCISCHDPHAPDPPHVPGACNACHTHISRTKALSPHALLECTQCHTTPEEHRIDPRSVLASKPVSRSDCGVCHGKNANSEQRIPRIDLAAHGDEHLCWECHYPHHPETQ